MCLKLVRWDLECWERDEEIEQHGLRECIRMDVSDTQEIIGRLIWEEVSKVEE